MSPYPALDSTPSRRVSHPSTGTAGRPCCRPSTSLPAFHELGDADALGRHYARLYGAYRSALAHDTVARG